MNRVKLVRRRVFREDLIEHYTTIAVEQPAAAERFAAEVDSIIGSLAHHPESGRVWEPDHPALTDVRFRVVTGFKVLLFYQVCGGRLILLRALHGARGDLQTVLTDDH